MFGGKRKRKSRKSKSKKRKTKRKIKRKTKRKSRRTTKSRMMMLSGIKSLGKGVQRGGAGMGVPQAKRRVARESLKTGRLREEMREGVTAEFAADKEATREEEKKRQKVREEAENREDPCLINLGKIRTDRYSGHLFVVLDSEEPGSPEALDKEKLALGGPPTDSAIYTGK